MLVLEKKKHGLGVLTSQKSVGLTSAETDTNERSDLFFGVVSTGINASINNKTPNKNTTNNKHITTNMTLKVPFLLGLLIHTSPSLGAAWTPGPNSSTRRDDGPTFDIGRREAIIVGGLASVGGFTIAVPRQVDAADLSTFQDGARGIKYQILKEGEGDKPVRAQSVKTKYTLWTGGFGEDGGKQIDSTNGFLRGPFPVVVGVGRVIKGWDLTLLDMKLGETRRIVIPSELGYGDKGAGGSIPPKATLYFEVELTEMDDMIELSDAQKQWLEDNPL